MTRPRRAGAEIRTKAFYMPWKAVMAFPTIRRARSRWGFLAIAALYTGLFTGPCPAIYIPWDHPARFPAQ